MDRRSFIAAAVVSAPGLAACGPGALPLPSRRPTTGLDPARVQLALTRGAELPRLHSLMIARDGQRLAQQVFRGPNLDAPVNIKSASKSVLAAVTGAALGAGVIQDLDQPIATWLADRFPSNPDPRLNRITIEHLLTMQAGLQSTSGANYGAWVSSRDWVRYALAQPFVSEPGKGLVYSTGTSHLLSALLTRAAGESTRALTRRLLADPLDISVPEWPADPQGIYFGGNDMNLSPEALLKIGELYRNDGLHQGRRVLPETWVERSWRGRGRSRYTNAPYGLGWWTRDAGGHETWYAWGYGGQMIFVTLSLNLTTVMTSDPSPRDRDDHVDQLHRLFAEVIVPAAETGAAPQ